MIGMLKCHNKCTKEAPPCHLLIIQRGGRENLKEAISEYSFMSHSVCVMVSSPSSVARLVRTESVPCDINNPLRYSDLHISQTLPKTNRINKYHCPPLEGHAPPVGPLRTTFPSFGRTSDNTAVKENPFSGVHESGRYFLTSIFPSGRKHFRRHFRKWS
ncbi:Kinase suppressor of Ras 2 [Liparis tanakae]|uniref:Kinase suppressor of Ras 2 n=1 Tax=Liparis tanakae TaxID=230148 RepID=A0A4Z2FXC5_9TELE|nr:Kinase suppressor of Ras 2 [Liparis tanakae]